MKIMSIKKIVDLLMEGFKEYNPVNVEYGKDQIVGFPNDLNGCDLVVYVKKEEIAEGNEYYEKSINSVIKVCGISEPLVTEYIIDERE